MTLRVLSWSRLEHGLAHGEHGVGIGRVGQEGGRVHGDVVVQQRHHVHEVVGAVSVEHLVHRLEDAPHGRADGVRGQDGRQGEDLLVELGDGVGEDVVDGLQDDRLQKSVRLVDLLDGFVALVLVVVCVEDGHEGLESVE